MNRNKTKTEKRTEELYSTTIVLCQKEEKGAAGGWAARESKDLPGISVGVGTHCYSIPADIERKPGNRTLEVRALDLDT